METRVFLEHYWICTDADDGLLEIGRSGAAINYRAIDQRSKQTVVVQLIPLVGIEAEARKQFEERARTAQKLDHVNIARVLDVGVDHEFAVVVSEFLDGEATDAWVVENGPMPMEATLRVALQVVRALEASSFFALSHRSLQPSNILIAPGPSPDGGWPFVKLLNFGLAGAESYVVDAAGRAIAPTMAPQYAGPEQLRNGPVDFSSEIYSLGAIICFLLTGTAPLGAGEKARRRLRSIPELRRAPRRVRKLIESMLSRKPENRPQDPVALEREMRECLTEIEHRQSLRRKFGIPAFVALPKWTSPSSPTAQVLRGAIAFVVLVLIGAGFAAVLLPDSFHFTRSTDSIGVPIGVPESAPTNNPAQNVQSPETTTTASTASAATVADKPIPSPSDAEVADSAPQVAAADSRFEPTPSASATEEKPPVSASATTKSEVASTHVKSNSSSRNRATTSDANNRVARVARVAARRSSTPPPRFASAYPRYSREPDFYPDAPPPRGSFRARLIGTTADGRPILRLPSGRIVIAVVGAPVEEYPLPRRQAVVRQPDGDDPPPFQPFNNVPND